MKAQQVKFFNIEVRMSIDFIELVDNEPNEGVEKQVLRHLTVDLACGGKVWFEKWLALELAPTITGNKPATVLSFINTSKVPFLTLWQQYGNKIIEDSILSAFSLKESAAGMTVLFYRSDALENCIMQSRHKEFLREQGYPSTAGVPECLLLLRQRFAHCCPHEIGVLLGIPLDDVLGFMGLGCQQRTHTACWQIYGNPERSLAVVKCFADDRARVADLLSSGLSAGCILCGRFQPNRQKQIAI